MINTTERTDIHRPSAIIPENYTFVAFDYLGGSDLGAIMMLKEQREIFRAHMNRTGGRWANHEHGGTCHVCGASASYLCIFHHAPSNSYIMTGEDCAQKLDMSYGDMNYFRRAVTDAREAQAGKKKAQAILSDAGLETVWALYGPDIQNQTGWRYEELTVNDMTNKLVRYGSLSDKQVDFMRTLLDKIANRAVIDAQRAAEHDAAADCPAGRVRIQGTVLAVKVVESAFGEQTKILVKADSGFKVWGSRFSASHADGGVQIGHHVDFTATVTVSDKDRKFGFFKRPVQFVDKKLVAFLATVAWG
jgi:hypothetical protein